MLSYYIYYRLRLDKPRADALDTLHAMQEALARRTGIIGRILRNADDPATWMEIYENVGDAERFDVALSEEVEAHRAADLLMPGTTRHLERFIPCV